MGTVGKRAVGDRSLGYKQEADKGVGGAWVQRQSQIDQQSLLRINSQGPRVGGFLRGRGEGRPMKGGTSPGHGEVKQIQSTRLKYSHHSGNMEAGV